ncbi:MAG: hypothetical protein WDN49_09350 [Acetobacteraceae bacterium]
MGGLLDDGRDELQVELAEVDHLGRGGREIPARPVRCGAGVSWCT